MKVYSKKEIFAQLEAMQAPRDKMVLMHSSLRTVGSVEGGAKGLLDILVEYFTGEGGLFCVPAHTWHNLDKEITLDMSSSDNCLGYFSTVAAEDPRGYRTESPTHSMVIFGDHSKAEALARGELLADTPTSPLTCYGKLYEEDGFVFLVGVAHNRNTYLHTVDEMLEIPNRMEKKSMTVAIRRKDGQVVKRSLRLFYTDYTEDISDRFIKYEIPFRYHRCGRDGFLGNAPTQLLSARKMKAVVEMIYKNSLTDPLKTENPIEAKYFINQGEKE
ncbi:MAG: AAC(3) family N-acetyltransferase [Ruminococcaceae bacterium]|nr:AAC(3) family N-acetyltransferase [Oscillospiraceae bacterium]